MCLTQQKQSFYAAPVGVILDDNFVAMSKFIVCDTYKFAGKIPV